jgi:hypothetical protein
MNSEQIFLFLAKGSGATPSVLQGIGGALSTLEGSGAAPSLLQGKFTTLNQKDKDSTAIYIKYHHHQSKSINNKIFR